VVLAVRVVTKAGVLEGVFSFGVGVRGTWVMVRAGPVLRLRRGFIGEESPEHACRDSGIDESVCHQHPG